MVGGSSCTPATGQADVCALLSVSVTKGQRVGVLVLAGMARSGSGAEGKNKGVRQGHAPLDVLHGGQGIQFLDTGSAR